MADFINASNSIKLLDWLRRFNRYSDERFSTTKIPNHQKIEIHYIGG
jgi:hypothetical protein